MTLSEVGVEITDTEAVDHACFSIILRCASVFIMSQKRYSYNFRFREEDLPDCISPQKVSLSTSLMRVVVSLS